MIKNKCEQENAFVFLHSLVRPRVCAVFFASNESGLSYYL